MVLLPIALITNSYIDVDKTWNRQVAINNLIDNSKCWIININWTQPLKVATRYYIVQGVALEEIYILCFYDGCINSDNS